MAWDTEGTKRKILQAAMVEFAQFGPNGTTHERIARQESIKNVFTITLATSRRYSQPCYAMN
ncbi:Uncharacterised protein [Serratia fonticola]|nr:Uncharacterised protein [Serratia fonticola]